MANENLKFKKGESKDKPEVDNGSLVVYTDTGELYLDHNGKRILLGNSLKLATELNSINAIINKEDDKLIGKAVEAKEYKQVINDINTNIAAKPGRTTSNGDIFGKGNSITSGEGNHVEGLNCTIGGGLGVHVEGNGCQSSNEMWGGHVEGYCSYAYANGAHAEGFETNAGIYQYYSHSTSEKQPDGSDKEIKHYKK